LTLYSIKYIITYMKAEGPKPDDAPGQSLLRLGSRIRLARTRRKLRQQDLAQQIGRARATVVAIEKGSPNTEIGAYAAALWALGLLQELDLVADPGLDRDGQALALCAADKRVRPRRQLNNKF
jgi:DNA-binding XRE family transcriptional regulator